MKSLCRALNFQSVSSRPQHAHNTTVWPSRADNTSTELARSGGSISLERSVSPSTQGDPRCARTLPYTTAGGIVLGNQVGGGGGGWGWGCVNRVVIPLPSLSCRCLYGLCLGSPPFSPQSRGLRRARAGRGAPRRPTRIGAWARAAPEARSRPGPRCTMGKEGLVGGARRFCVFVHRRVLRGAGVPYPSDGRQS